ncbi:MAG: c-type cytochrome [Taibaiella sp.]|nr:c-type cytochrome [Taibaiella sp.]
MLVNKKRVSFIIIALLLIPTIASAEDKSADHNIALISLSTLLLVLLFIIGVLGSILRQMTIAVRDKMRKDKQASGNVVKTVLCLLLFSIPTLRAPAAEVVETWKVGAPVQSAVMASPQNDLYAIITIIMLEIAVIFALVIIIKLFIRLLSSENKEVAQKIRYHLPAWLKPALFVTIMIAVIGITHLYIFHDSSHTEPGLVSLTKTAASNTKTDANIDENNVTTLTDAAEITAGKGLFITTCAPCHLADGGGVVGPNLTDAYWLHGGSIKDIFKTIKNGWPDKGMRSFKEDYTPKQIQELASFIISLKGTHPLTPKDAQGELYKEL